VPRYSFESLDQSLKDAQTLAVHDGITLDEWLSIHWNGVNGYTIEYLRRAEYYSFAFLNAFLH
jgi:hypothetical protein